MVGLSLRRPEFATYADPLAVAQAIRDCGVALVRAGVNVDFVASVPKDFHPERGNPSPGYEVTTLRHNAAALVAAYSQSCVLETARLYLGKPEAPEERDYPMFRLRRAAPTVPADCMDGWHNDGWGANHGGMVVIWTAVTRCGSDSPSLAFIVDANADNWKPPSMSPATYGPPDVRERELVEHFGSNALWCPTLLPGDTFLFGPFTLHGIHREPSMSHPRISIEARFLATHPD
jgi:hypothetical protein